MEGEVEGEGGEWNVRVECSVEGGCGVWSVRMEGENFI